MRPFIDGPGTVVVGVDGSPTSDRALQSAFDHARDEGGQVVAVFATPPVTVIDAFSNVMVIWNEDVEAPKARVAALAERSGVPALFVTGQGDPAALLLHVSRSHLADVIMLGARRARWFARSVPARVARRSSCRLVVVP